MGGGVRERSRKQVLVRLNIARPWAMDSLNSLLWAHSCGNHLVPSPEVKGEAGQRHAQCASPHIFLMPGSFHLVWGLVCGWTSLSLSIPSRKRTRPSFLWLAERASCHSAWKSYRRRSPLGHLNRWGLRWGFLKFGRKVGMFSQAWL